MVNWWKQEKRGVAVAISWQKKHARVYSFFQLRLQSKNYLEIVSKQSEQRRWYCQLSPLIGSWIKTLFPLRTFAQIVQTRLFFRFLFSFSLLFLSLMFAYDLIWPGLPFCGKLNLIASNNFNIFYFSTSSSANSFPVFGCLGGLMQNALPA